MKEKTKHKIIMKQRFDTKAEEIKFLRKKYFDYTQQCLKNGTPIMKFPEWQSINRDRYIY